MARKHRNGHNGNGNGRHNGNGQNGKRARPLKDKQQEASPKDVDDEILRIQALELRRTGASYRAIATAMTNDMTVRGTPRVISKDVAHRLVIEGLRDLREHNAETLDEVRRLELERLDYWTMKLQTGEKASTPRTVDTLLRIQERRARLQGLDAPTRIAGADGGPIELAVIDARSLLRERLDALRKAMQGEPVVVVESASSPPAIPENTGGDAAQPDSKPTDPPKDTP